MGIGVWFVMGYQMLVMLARLKDVPKVLKADRRCEHLATVPVRDLAADAPDQA